MVRTTAATGRVHAGHGNVQSILPGSCCGKVQHRFLARANRQRRTGRQCQSTRLVGSPNLDVHRRGLSRRIGHDQLLGHACFGARHHQRLLQSRNDAGSSGNAFQISLSSPRHHRRGRSRSIGSRQQSGILQLGSVIDRAGRHENIIIRSGIILVQHQ